MKIVILLRLGTLASAAEGSLAQHPFLYCGEWQGRGKTDQIMYVVKGGKIVWTYSIPGREEFGDCTMLSNGNTVICNWSGSLPLADWPQVVQVIEIKPAKKVVWALREWDRLGPASAIQLLDGRGVPEDGDLQR